jgi:hypothetical protein
MQEEEEEEEEYLQETERHNNRHRTQTDRQTACVGGEKEEETAATAATTTTEQIGLQVTAVIEPVGKQHSRGGGGGGGKGRGWERDRCRWCKGRDDVQTPISSTKNKLKKHTLHSRLWMLQLAAAEEWGKCSNNAKIFCNCTHFLSDTERVVG